MGAPPLSSLIPDMSRRMPRSKSCMAPARGNPFTSFWIATLGWTFCHSSSGIQRSMVCHCCWSRNGVLLSGKAEISNCPLATAARKSWRRWGVAACHQSQTATVVSAVQEKRASAGLSRVASTPSMARSRKRRCSSRHTAG